MDCNARFSAARMVIKIVVAVLVAAEICNWMAFCTTYWYVRPEYTYIGLWRTCDSRVCSVLDGSSNLSNMAVQAFAIFGFVSVNLSFVFILLYIFTVRYKNMLCLSQAAISLLFIAVVSWLISVVIFGTQVCNLPDKNRTCHFSYGLAVCTPILALVAALLLVKDTKDQGIGLNQRSVQVGTTVDLQVTRTEQHVLMN
ncbi:hypothetical protein Btru_004950 [Bulinus truncatus]|nr:hypothetical protein Btru_004950 [Bulinus truncatus]